MKSPSSKLFLASIVATCLGGSPTLAETPQSINTEMRLEGHCGKIFGRTRMTFDDRSGAQNPIAPFLYQELPNASCTVTLKYRNRTTSKPVVGLSVQSSRVLSTNSNGTKTQDIATVKTNANGVVRFKFRWDETSCGVDFAIFDPKDPSQSRLTWPITLLTRDAFFQIHQCQGTFISEGLSREDICNGEPKDH